MNSLLQLLEDRRTRFCQLQVNRLKPSCLWTADHAKLHIRAHRQAFLWQIRKLAEVQEHVRHPFRASDEPEAPFVGRNYAQLPGLQVEGLVRFALQHHRLGDAEIHLFTPVAVKINHIVLLYVDVALVQLLLADDGRLLLFLPFGLSWGPGNLKLHQAIANVLWKVEVRGFLQDSPDQPPVLLPERELRLAVLRDKANALADVLPSGRVLGQHEPDHNADLKLGRGQP